MGAGEGTDEGEGTGEGTGAVAVVGIHALGGRYRVAAVGEGVAQHDRQLAHACH